MPLRSNAGFMRLAPHTRQGVSPEYLLRKNSVHPWHGCDIISNLLALTPFWDNRPGHPNLLSYILAADRVVEGESRIRQAAKSECGHKFSNGG
jgi:hypothetical protein